MKIAIVATLELATLEIDLVEFLAIFSVVALAVQGLLHLRFSSRAGDMTKFQKIA